MSQIVLTHALRQASVSLIFDVRQKNMPSTFRIHATYERSSDRNIVLCGVISKGASKIGMKAKVEMNPQLYLVADIVSIEGIRGPAEADTGLVIDTPDDDTRALWRDLPEPGETIEIE